MSNPKTPPIVALMHSSAFKLIEIVLVAAALGGVALHYNQSPLGADIMSIAFPVLAIYYFLLAFRAPLHMQETTNEKSGFFSLLTSTIGPKLGYIGSAVCLMGIYYGFIKLPGAQQMLMIGSPTTTAAALLMLVGLGSGSDNLDKLIRFAVVAAAGWYTFFGF